MSEEEKKVSRAEMIASLDSEDYTHTVAGQVAADVQKRLVMFEGQEAEKDKRYIPGTMVYLTYASLCYGAAATGIPIEQARFILEEAYADKGMEQAAEGRELNPEYSDGEIG